MLLGCTGLILGLLLATVIFLLPSIRLVMTAKDRGVFDETTMREYEGSSMENLKGLHTALMIYHDSNEMFPEGNGWMDAVWPSLKTNDLSEEEATKKLKNPIVAAENPLSFGYAFNDLFSGQYIDDVDADPAKTPLVFDSSDLSRNAFGLPAQLAPEPARPGGNKAVTAEGNVVDLSTLLNR